MKTESPGYSDRRRYGMSNTHGKAPAKNAFYHHTTPLYRPVQEDTYMQHEGNTGNSSIHPYIVISKRVKKLLAFFDEWVLSSDIMNERTAKEERTALYLYP
ncbi:hypothetical protein J6590_023714 [Homalodisca vitripennis]|nr:hypothetical protein J6590_023714 [Homalodisca vitripennis]